MVDPTLIKLFAFTLGLFSLILVFTYRLLMSVSITDTIQTPAKISFSKLKNQDINQLILKQLESKGHTTDNFALLVEISSYCEKVQLVINNSRDNDEMLNALSTFQREIESFVVDKGMEHFDLTQIIYNASLKWINQYRS